MRTSLCTIPFSPILAAEILRDSDIGAYILVYVTAMPFSLVKTTIVPEILKPQKPGHQLTVIRIRPRRSVVHENTRPRNGGHVLSYDLTAISHQEFRANE